MRTAQKKSMTHDSIEQTAHSLHDRAFLDDDQHKKIIGRMPTTFRESSEELLMSLEQTPTKSFLCTTEDLEETNLSEQSLEEQKLYRQLFNRIFIDNYTTKRVFEEEIRLLDRIDYPEIFKKILEDTLDQAALTHRQNLREKVYTVAQTVALSGNVTLKQLYHRFQDIIDVINILIDFKRQIRSYSMRVDTLLRCLEAMSMMQPTDFTEEYLHYRMMRIVLHDQLIESVCQVARRMLKTKSFMKFQDESSCSQLKFIIDCCLSGSVDSLDSAFSSNSSQFDDDYEQDEHLLKMLRQMVPAKERLQCNFSAQFLKGLQKKLKKK